MNTNLHTLLRSLLLFGLVLSLIGLRSSGWRVAAGPQSAPQASNQNGLAGALNADGTLRAGASGSFDTSDFRMELTATGAPRFVEAQAVCNGWDTQFSLPNGVNGTVFALVVSGTDIYVGGVFSAAVNVAANNVAKFNTLTNTWSALGTGGGKGVNGSVFALAVSGSDLYVGGDFAAANVDGATVSAFFVAMVNTTTGVWTALGTGGGKGVNDSVNALAVSGSDLYVGGEFTTANAGGPGVSANRVAKVNTTTGVWSAFGTGGGNGVDSNVFALAVSGADLYVGGIFMTANVGGPVLSAKNVAKVNTTSGVWSALGTGGGNGVNSLVFDLVINGSDLFAGGIFTRANEGGSNLIANRVAKVNPTTGLWSALGAGGGNGLDGFVNALIVSGTDIFVGGDFTVAGNAAANHVAKFSTLTNAWSVLGTGGGNGVNGTVHALTMSGSDLYVGGVFTMANVGGPSLSTNNVAKFNTLTGVWSALGTVGGNGVDSIVFALAVSGSDLFVGGSFSMANVGGPQLIAIRLAKVNTTTGVWSAFGTGGGNGVNGGVSALAVSGSDLYVGGSFMNVNVGGPVLNANNVVKVNTTTGVWSALGTGSGNGVVGGVGSTVSALLVSGSDLYVGGFFTTANPGFLSVSANNVAKFNTLTNTWSALGPFGNGVNDGVVDLAMSGSDLYVGGFFTTVNLGVGGLSASRVAKYNTTTGVWSVIADVGGGNGWSALSMPSWCAEATCSWAGTSSPRETTRSRRTSGGFATSATACRQSRLWLK